MIYITDTLRINKVDDRCLQLEAFVETVSKKEKEKSMHWKRVGYYGNLKDAFQGVLRKQLFNTAEEELSLKDVIERINMAEENITRTIKETLYDKKD